MQLNFPLGILPSTDRLSEDYRHERSIIVSDEDVVSRTAHSRFNLPFDIDDKPIGKVSKQSRLGKMIVEARLIIWDEATMANHHSVESLDDVLRDASLPFGGKLVLLGGDFRQTLPVVIRGSRESTVAACITSSHIWCNVTRLELSENMRARHDPDFIAFLLRIGNGVEPVISDDNIHIPNEMLIPFVDSEVSFGCLVDSVYPSFDILSANPYASVNREILTPKNEYVDYINDLLIDRFTGQVNEYISFRGGNFATWIGSDPDPCGSDTNGTGSKTNLYE